MFEPFIWMFKTKLFYKRFFQLLITIVIFLSLALISCLAASLLPIGFSAAKWFYVASAALPILLILFIQGYFWELTAKIISRDVDIEASNIYSGKIKNIFIIDLPDFRPFTYIWRGFASVIASILMFIPFVLLVLSSQYTQIFFLPYDNIEFYHRLYTICYNIIYFLFFALIPAMLWNYARQNSVVAVWDLRKAIYLFETYPFRYIWNTILFILFYLFNYYLLAGFAVVNGAQEILFKSGTSSFFTSMAACVGVILFIFAVYVIYLYSLHVYAYLLGTIASYTEG